MRDSYNDSPKSPLHRKVVASAEARHKLRLICEDAELNDLPLDYLHTTSFSDLYLYDGLLGAGSFGVALKAIHKHSATQCAIKVISLLTLRSSLKPT